MQEGKPLDSPRATVSFLLRKLLQQSDGARLWFGRMRCEKDSLRPIHRTSSFVILYIKVRAFRNEEVDDVVGSAIGRSMDRSQPHRIHRIHVLPQAIQELHGLQE